MAARLLPGSPVNKIRRLNEMLSAKRYGRVAWIDMEALAQDIGTRRFAPNKFYYAAKLGATRNGCRTTCRCSARPGGVPMPGQKGVVLDLDNTLWGGVIGDDGVDEKKSAPPDRRARRSRSGSATCWR